MFYIKYVVALIAFVAVALKASFITRTLQRVTDWLVEMAEVLLSIPSNYMVVAELMDIDGKITFLIFAAIFFNLLRLMKLAYRSLKATTKAALQLNKRPSA